MERQQKTKLFELAFSWCQGRSPCALCFLFIQIPNAQAQWTLAPCVLAEAQQTLDLPGDKQVQNSNLRAECGIQNLFLFVVFSV